MPRLTAVEALTSILPLLPLPSVKAKSRAPLAMVKVEVSRVIFPAFPVHVVEVVMVPCPSIVIALGASIVKLPPVPSLEVEADICAPSWNKIDKICPPSYGWRVRFPAEPLLLVWADKLLEESSCISGAWRVILPACPVLLVLLVI